MKTLLSVALFVAAAEVGYWVGVAMGRATCKRCDPDPPAARLYVIQGDEEHAR